MAMTDEERDALLVRISALVDRIADDVDTLKHVVLEGNGKPALTVQVAELGGRVDAVESNRAGRVKIAVAVIGFLAGGWIVVSQLV